MEGLKLIDLGNEVNYIEIDTRKVPYNFSVKLQDKTYTFCIKYNEVGGFFTADLSITATGELLVYGDIVRYGRRTLPHPGYHSDLPHRRQHP